MEACFDTKMILKLGQIKNTEEQHVKMGNDSNGFIENNG